MISVTKIFRFETAHAIHEYDGLCKNIHGHSYELHVTVSASSSDDFILANGFVIDFKELKSIVKTHIIDYFDHQIILSEKYLASHPNLNDLENLAIWKVEPSAENIILFIKEKIEVCFGENVKLIKLKLYETADSFAEWEHK
jgi:6-pyruvoyltetrahydropterin/6-carboxytetrahydropterin synthase